MTVANCVICYWLQTNSLEEILNEKGWCHYWNICSKHKKGVIDMDCSICGSQDTTMKTGISKTGKNARKPWKAYDCNEPQCKNEKGYPSRTFAPLPRSSGGNFGVPGQMQRVTPNLEGKLEMIYTILATQFPEAVRKIAERASKPENDLPF